MEPFSSRNIFNYFIKNLYAINKILRPITKKVKTDILWQLTVNVSKGAQKTILTIPTGKNCVLLNSVQE